MTRIYAVYCKVTLVREPPWLDQFRRKYDKPYDLHLTLKQSAAIESAQLDEIKRRLAETIDRARIAEHKFSLTFDKLVVDEYDEYDKGGYIYLFSDQHNEQLDNLQRQIRMALQNFSDYLNPESRGFEQDFNPHITIARHLDEATLHAAVDEVEDDCSCDGEITEIVLSCISEATVEEATKPDNLTIFRL